MPHLSIHISGEEELKPLRGVRVLTLAANVPGPVAAARLHALGADVIKIEPPAGDPLARISPAWYESLAAGQRVVHLDLKERGGRARLDGLLTETDLLLTSTRPAALGRLSLNWAELHARYPRLSHVAITGYLSPDTDRAGHDLTYQAELGLLSPPFLPRTLLADLAGAESATSAALALLLARERSKRGGYAQVSLMETARAFAKPLRYGVTARGGPLGGGYSGYNLYRTRDGWVAVAALEPHFWQRLQSGLGVSNPTAEELARVFLTRTTAEWAAWGTTHDLPLAPVREIVPESD